MNVGPETGKAPGDDRDPTPRLPAGAGRDSRVEVVDLPRHGAGSAGNGVIWTLEPDSDLNVNLVRLDPGSSIAAHGNDEVDVVLVVIDGAGELQVDGATWPLGPSTLAHVPRGTRRSIQAGAEPLVYLSMHRRRAGLMIKPTGRPGSSDGTS